MKGTLLNTATVLTGGALGLGLGRFVPTGCQEVAIQGLGLVVCLLGARMFFQGKNPIISVAAIALGGVIGYLLGIPSLLLGLAEWVRSAIGGGGRFNEALVTTSVLYCVGPMTILGCLQEAVEGEIEILATKSTLDGISSVFFAATLGYGVLVTAGVILLFQGALTLAARPLHKLLKEEGPVLEATAVGGAMIVGIGIGLLGVKKLNVEVYLPALILAPLFSGLQMRLENRKRLS